MARQISNGCKRIQSRQARRQVERHSKCIQIQSVTTTISINSCVAAFIGFVMDARAYAFGSFVAKLPRSSSRATSSLSFSCWALIGYNANKQDCHSIYPQPASVRLASLRSNWSRRISCPLPLACASRPLLHILNLFASPPVLPHAYSLWFTFTTIPVCLSLLNPQFCSLWRKMNLRGKRRPTNSHPLAR